MRAFLSILCKGNDVGEAIRLNDWPGYQTGELEPPEWLKPALEAVAA